MVVFVVLAPPKHVAINFHCKTLCSGCDFISLLWKYGICFHFFIFFIKFLLGGGLGNGNEMKYFPLLI